MNILVIFTGGTIASGESNGYLGPNDTAKRKLLSLYKDNCAHKMREFDIHFETLSPYQILSENLEAAYINQLVDVVSDVTSGPAYDAVSVVTSDPASDTASVVTSDPASDTVPDVMSTCSYDGIIVTHGTDTLQYTAAALGLCFRNTRIPIILVSSNFILDDPRANGLTNFTAAVEYICGKNESGVFVSYANTGHPAVMHPATKLLPHAAYSDDLYSSKDFADINLFDSNEENIDFSSVRLCEQSPVMFFHAMPCQMYPALTDETKAVIMESYHSGTLCTASSPLKSFCEEAFAKNIPIYLVGVEDRTAYESTKAYEGLHIRVLPKASPITAYMLAWYLYSRG